MRLLVVRERRSEQIDADPDIRAASRGDRAALARLWEAHRVWVAAVVDVARPRDAELEDLLQEVALRLVTKLGALTDPLRLRPWLRSVARNVCVDAARRSALRRSEERELDRLPLEGAESMRVLEARDELARTRAALEQLPADARELLALRAIEGLSQRELAETLELPETTIESRLVRARRALRAALRNPHTTRKCLQ